MTLMPRNLTRYQEAGHLHFVTFSCYRRQPFLADPAWRDLFELSLDKMRLRYDFFVIAYVVMPEDVHLLVSEPKTCLLAKALQALKLSVAVQLGDARFWQRRYYDFNVFSEEKIIEKCRYIHCNPGTRGLATQPDQWLWSSFNHWLTGEVGSVEIESHWTVRKRGGLGLALHTDPDSYELSREDMATKRSTCI